MTHGRDNVALLSVRDLRASLSTPRGPIRAVDRVSFTLDRGRTLGIVGESGCGKSMLARTLMGLLPAGAVIASDSAVDFDGCDLTGLSAKKLRRIIGRDIAMIFQDPMTSLNPVMPVGRQVAEVVRYHLKTGREASQRRARELLDLVGIPMAAQRADQYPHHLSGGLRQRVAIAIALACEPKLLIADEPTTALDVTVQAAILDLLGTLQHEKKMAMILITHDLGVVAGRTHETAVMYAGRIVEQAPTRDLFRGMAMPYTRALMAAIPRLSDRPHKPLRVIDGQPPDLAALPAGCRFAPRCWKTQPLCRDREPVLKALDARPHRAACWYPLIGEEAF